MARREFPAKVRVAAIKRADGKCEAPGCGLPHLGRFEIDHIIADALGGEPTLSNARLLCVACHGAKTKLDTTLAAKVKRQEAAHLRGRIASKQPIRSAPFPASGRRLKHPMAALPPRRLFEEA